MDVIKKLNRLRLERNLSVYRLAELSGLNQSTLANTFSRGTVPSITHLQACCDVLGVTLAQFFTEDEEHMELTPQEIEFMRNFRMLPDKLKNSVAEIVNEIPYIRN